jgi:hypothetical protein
MSRRSHQPSRFLAKKHKGKIRIESIGDFNTSPHEISTTPNLSPPVLLSDSTQLDAQLEATVQANDEIEMLPEIDQATLIRRAQRRERRAMFNFKLPVELAQLVFDYAINSERESVKEDLRMWRAIKQTCGRWREMDRVECHSDSYNGRSGLEQFINLYELGYLSYSSVRKLELVFRPEDRDDIEDILLRIRNLEMLSITLESFMHLSDSFWAIVQVSNIRRLRCVSLESESGEGDSSIINVEL